MNLNLRRTALRLAPVLAVLAGAGTLAAVQTAGPSAAAATPALGFVVIGQTQTVERYQKEPVYLYGLGQYAVAHQTVEVRTHSGKSYQDPVRTTLSVGGVTTTLPDGLTSTPNQLSKFFDVKVANSAGKSVVTTTLDFCPNSWSRARMKVDAPAQSPFPRECGNHPFAVGSVFGITEGWSTPVLNEYESPVSFTGPDGTYQLKVAVSRPWRQALGLTLGQATMQSTIKVKTVKGSAEGVAAGAHHQHEQHEAMTGDVSPQMKILHAARKKALGVPNTPAKNPPSNQRSIGTLALADVPKADLRSLPAYQIRADVQGREDGPKKTYLSFGATVWNAGPSPLVVDGFREPGKDVLAAYQYFFDAQDNQVGYTRAGEMEWDPRDGHNHWHFRDFASYRLLDSTKKKAIISGKEAFCLAPTDPVDLTVDAADWLPASTDLHTACGQGNKNLLSIREVLGTGWGDTYSQDLPGQSFDITRVPSGTYYVQTIANPERRLTESNYDNNSALRKVSIGGPVGGKRTVKVHPYQGIKD